MNFEQVILGQWRTEHGLLPVKVIGYRAGNLLVETVDGKALFGSVDSFRSDDGLSGAPVMERLMPPPRVADLIHGCLRETLVNAASAARIGRQETRDFDGPDTYFADDNEGCVTCVSFVESECVGLGFSDDPFRRYDYRTSLPAMPALLRARAEQVAAWPFFAGQEQPFTAAFWSEDGVMVSVEPWYEVYAFTGGILEKELCSDSKWIPLAVEDSELSTMILRLIVDISSGVGADGRIEVNPAQRAVLFPPGEPHSAAAIEELVAGGRVEFTNWCQQPSGQG